MLQYRIADIVLSIEGDIRDMPERLKEFRSYENQPADLKILAQSSEFIEELHGELIIDEMVKWVKKPPGQGYGLFMNNGLGTTIVQADIDPQWRNASFKFMDYDNKSSEESFKEQTKVYLSNLVGMFFRYGILHHEGLIIHSSTLKWNGKGIMFSAPSGTGKSTHVQLWQKYIGDQVIVLNDDTPAVRLVDGNPVVYGTPWAGSSNIHCNDSAPVAAIVILQQAPHNSIRLLSLQEAIVGLLPRTLLPYFYEDLMNIAMNVFEKIVSSVPVYLLQCRPDQEAVEMVYQCVK